MSEKEAKIPDGYVFEDGVVRLERFDACGNGHTPALPGWGKCPHCPTMTMRFSCRDPHCDGVLTSTAHQKVCGKRT